MSMIKNWLVGFKDYLLGNDIKLKETCDVETKICVETMEDVSDLTLIDKLELDKYPDATRYDGTVGKPKLLLMDDLDTTLTLFKTDIEYIKSKYNKNVLDDFDIYLALGSDTGYIALKFIRDVKPDYLVLDITIGNMTKFEDGSFLDLDGIDVAKYNSGLNPDSKFILSTAHKLHGISKIRELYVNKFKTYFNQSMKKHTMSKQDGRSDNMYYFLYGE